MSGRNTVMTEITIGKLEEGFMMGLSDKEACLFADIHPSTLYDYTKLNPEFSERKELLKHNIRMQAKFNLVRSIRSGDVSDSKWYLERKAKDEFSIRYEEQIDNKDLFPAVINIITSNDKD